jgi:hypothetical protein
MLGTLDEGMKEVTDIPSPHGPQESSDSDEVDLAGANPA